MRATRPQQSDMFIEQTVTQELERIRFEWEFEQSIPRKHVLERAYNALARKHNRKTRIWFDLHMGTFQHNLDIFHPREN